MSELSNFLKNKGIDEIEDYEKFCYAEYDAIYAYCTQRNFKLSDDDIQTIVSKGIDRFDFVELILKARFNKEKISMNGKYMCLNTYENEIEEYGTDFLFGKCYNYKNGYMHSTENGTDVMIPEEELKRYWRKVN